MANPFLFMDEEVSSAVTTFEDFSNPFLVEDDTEDCDFSSENPFSSSNPFALNETSDHCDVEPTGASLFLVEDDEVQVDVTMSFFGTTINEYDSLQQPSDSNMETNINDVSEDELKINKPPRPNPPSQVTQQLITNLTDHLDQTSTNLLGKLPVTRTPSPVSLRDLHSPSPTPDVAELLDETENFNISFERNAIADIKPSRPPPPRPLPPRPTNPSKTSPVTTAAEYTNTEAASQPQEEDLFNFFGTGQQKKLPPKPPAPKSKEDILSLFAAPTQSNQKTSKPDLLSEDIDFSIQNRSQSDAPVSVVPSFDKKVDVVNNTLTQPMQQLTDELTSSENSLIKAQGLLIVSSTEAVSDDVEMEDDISKPEIETNSYQDKEEEDVNLTEPSFTVTIHNSNDDETTSLSRTLTPPEQLQQLQFLQQKSSEFQHQRPTTPDPIVAQPELAPIFGGALPSLQAKPAPPPPPRGSSVLSTVHQSLVPEIFKSDEFDDFSAKFESKSQTKPIGNAFADGLTLEEATTIDAWGESDAVCENSVGNENCFANDDGFDSWDPPVVPDSTPYMNRRISVGTDDGKDFSVVIRPKTTETECSSVGPILGPPPQKSPFSGSAFSEDLSPKVNPFETVLPETNNESDTFERRTSQDSGPGTPLFDEDVSQPLEDFPRIFYQGPGWEMQLRQPNKKKITGQRFWKKVFVRIVFQGDNPVVQLLNKDTDKEPFQELPLQGCYSISEIAAQQFDNFGKIFTIKLQYVFYKERPGVRPGQVTKAERITTKLSMFAKYAIDGDYQGVKEFGSDLKKLGLPVEHAPQISQLFKLGSMNFEDLKQFSMCIEESLFKLNVHRDRALTYKMEEVQVTAVDEIYVEQNAEGHIEKQIARVRLFFLGFLSGMPDIELGVNDLWRQGKEVVGRHDIIPVATEEWIRLEGVEFHSCVQQDQYERTRTIKFKPPDACYIELMRFRVRPPKNRELPLQLKAAWVVTGNKVQLRADVLVPGFTSRKLGQIPCEDVAIRFPIPECWIYLFRVEKHFRYGSVKSTHRRTGKIKGIERFLGTVETLQESLIEVTSGQAKYEHHHRAIVWRCPRLPKEGQGAYTTHQLICRLALTSFDQIPDQLAPFAYIEFTMPATQVSHTTVRSISVQESDSDEPPEKYVRYLARHEYRVGIEHTMGESQNAYLAATTVKPQTIREEPVVATPMAHSDSESDSN